MSELTDLELNKKIAAIDGVEVYEEDNQFYGHVLFRKQRVAGLGPEVYDPARNWNITGPLMVKHEIDLEKCHNEKVGYCASSGLISERNLNPQRAILLAIVAKYEAVK